MPNLDMKHTNYIKTRLQHKTKILQAAKMQQVKTQQPNGTAAAAATTTATNSLQVRSSEELMERRRNSTVGEDDSDAFFGKVEATFNVKIPSHLKAMLKFHGFGNRISFARLHHLDLFEIQRFGREDLRLVLENDEEILRYYGPFSSCTNKFTIVNGERKLLLRIKEEVRRHSLDYR